MSSLLRWPCPACGHQTIEAPPPGPPGTWAACPVCRWVDAPEWDTKDPRTGRSANAIRLLDAQRSVLAVGAVTEWRLDEARAPQPGEERADGWRSLDSLAAEERAAVLAELEAAFDGVSREGGVSLHETVPKDLYQGDEARRAARALDTESRWQDVPHADLGEVCGVGGSGFLDPIGWRYYLPAYMSWFLSGGETSGSFAADCVLYDLRPPDVLTDSQLKRYTSLSAPQAAAVTRFLRFVERFSQSESYAKDAREALVRYWDKRPPAKGI